jgi:hypothetical protein
MHTSDLFLLLVLELIIFLFLIAPSVAKVWFGGAAQMAENSW